MRYLTRGEIPGCFYSTFNVPNLIDAIPWYDTNVGYSIGELQYGDIPNITGRIRFGYGDSGTDPWDATGAFYGENSGYRFPRNTDPNNGFKDILFDASRSSSVYKSVSGVKPKRLYVGGYIVKY